MSNVYLDSAEQVYDWLAGNIASSHEQIQFALVLKKNNRAVGVSRTLGGFAVKTRTIGEEMEIENWEEIPPLSLLEGRIGGPATFIFARAGGFTRRWMAQP
jgi:hypothetical protein